MRTFRSIAFRKSAIMKANRISKAWYYHSCEEEIMIHWLGWCIDIEWVIWK